MKFRRSRYFAAFTALLLGAASLPAQNVEQVAATSQADLEGALKALAEARQRIADERIPLSRRINELEGQVIEQRRAVDRAQRFQENRLLELNALRTEVNRAGDEGKFINSLLAEYATRFETRINIAEVERYRPLVEPVKEAGSLADRSPAERIEVKMRLVEASLDRLGAMLGGDRFPGRATTASGVVEEGQFLLAGPAAFFASAQSPAVGAVQLQMNTTGPSVATISGVDNAALRKTIETGAGLLAVDTTMGNALKFEATRDSFLGHVKKGGPVMIPILGLGIFALVIFVGRWIAVGRIRLVAPADLRGILEALSRQDVTKANSLAGAVGGPAGAMLTEAIKHFRERKEYVEEVMYEKLLVAKPDLEKLLPFLALAAAAAPLLGLLGTVTGMINTFNAITVLGAGDPKTLAGGISEALITTEFGLIVAIPALILHAILSRRVKGILGSMEQTATGFINGLPGQSEETIFFTKP